MDPQPIDPRGSTDGGGSGRRRWWQRKPRWPKAVFLEHRELIATVATRAARRSGFLEQDVEDFVSRVMVRMIEDDYAVIRRHRGDSSLRTFLITVVQNHCRDYRNHKWGKFRPSAIALELGTVAVELELLLVRDQHDLDTAIEILRSRGPRALSREELPEIVAVTHDLVAIDRNIDAVAKLLARHRGGVRRERRAQRFHRRKAGYPHLRAAHLALDDRIAALTHHRTFPDDSSEH